MQRHSTSLNVHAFQELVKSCAKTKSAIETQQVHVLVIKEGLQSEPLVGTALIDIYGKCGLIIQARKLFEDLLSQDVVAWTALIAGYAEYGAWIQTMKLLEQMQVEGISPNAVTYLCILKGLGSVHALDCGHQVYIDIISYGFETDLYVGSTLVDFYGKCGSVLEAEAVFKKLPQRNEFSWNALISAYAEDNGHSEKLFRMLEQMQTEGFSPDAVTYICSLKSCSTAGNLERGRYMHMEIVKCELDMAVSVSNSLVCMYAKCGSLAEAEDAFDRLPQHNIISWTALLVGYAEHGIDDKAIMCFDQMQSRGLCLDAMTFIGILKAVIRQKDRMRGQDVHLLIIKEGFEADLFIGNSLIDFYSQSGLLHEALDILQEMPSRDVISWNSLIAGLLENEAAEEALMCLERMQKDHLVPDAITLMCGLRACSLLGDLVSGQQLHGCITKQGYDSDLYVGNSLIDMHAKCGMLIDACHSFDGLPMRDVASWTARISGLCDHGFGVEALDAFEDMQKEGVMPNVATYICCLKACASIRAIESGQVLYIRITKEGLDTFPPLGSSIVDMYAKCGILLDAQAIFEGLSTKDELSYNALLWGYAEHGYKVEAFKCLGCMTLEGILPDVITYGSILKACGSSGNFCYGQDMHTEIIQRGFERDALIADLLVDLYAKCGLHAEARSLCKGFSFQGVIPWNMLISGYVEHGDSEEALKCLVQMGEEGIHPDKITCVMCLKACGNIGSLYKGRRLHAYIIEEKLEADLFISNTLVDMYAKCGLLAEAKGLFDDLPDIDVVSWNVLVAGYASQGESCYVSILLERMGQAGMTLNGTTIVSILTVSNHSGLIEECVQYFEGLNRRLAHCLTIDHYNCMIDLLGRAGQLEQVHMMSEQMPFHPNLVTWSSVLSSSRKNGYINFGIWAFNSSLCLNQSEASVYVSMANMCVDTCAENVSSKVLLCLQIDELMQL